MAKAGSGSADLGGCLTYHSTSRHYYSHWVCLHAPVLTQSSSNSLMLNSYSVSLFFFPLISGNFKPNTNMLYRHGTSKLTVLPKDVTFLINVPRGGWLNMLAVFPATLLQIDTLSHIYICSRSSITGVIFLQPELILTRANPVRKLCLIQPHFPIKTSGLGHTQCILWLIEFYGNAL